jgi:hypothetical protein
MRKQNTGAGRLSARVNAIAVLCALLLCSALLSAPPSGVLSAGERVGSGAPAAPDAMCGQVVASPAPDGSHLAGVAAVSADDVWAVGSYSNAGIYQTLVEHWNGRAWTVATSPNAGDSDNHLTAVAVVSADDVWAVGLALAAGERAKTLVEHWDGAAWTVVPSPSPGSYSNYLFGVTAVSADDVWAVGQYANPEGPMKTLVEHWDGAAWTVVPSPNEGIGGNNLVGASAVSADDVWAVGYYASSSRGPNQTLVEHWNGAAWTLVDAPMRGGWEALLNGVAAVSATDVWAVGLYYDPKVLQNKTLVARWNGAAWTVVPSPNASTYLNWLAGVVAVSANDVWAVGYFESDGYPHGPAQTLVMHWNGAAWALLASPSPGDAESRLSAVAAGAADDVWAVGFAATGSAEQTLLERYAPCADATPTPVPPTPCAGFSDVPSDSAFAPYITCLVSHGIVSGYADCAFRPNNSVTRGQAAKILALAAGYGEAVPPTRQTFTDVAPDSAFWVYIERLALHGVVSGYADGTYRSANNVTRGQAAKIVAKAFLANCQALDPRR